MLISQIGLIVTNQIASTAAASGPAIYNYTWLVLMLPYGMIGVTVLTVVMPRLSRNAAADDADGVLADLSLATRLTMVTLIPAVAFMTVGGSAMGSALFAYGHFGDIDAGHLGAAIAMSAFTLLPYSVVLLQLRVFYARQQPWIPIAIIVVITIVKIAASLVAPHMTSNPDLVAGYLGLANGLGFVAGAVAGYVLLRNTLRPNGGHLLGVAEVRTILVTATASLLAGLVAYLVDVLTGMQRLTAYGGGAGSLLRLVVFGGDHGADRGRGHGARAGTRGGRGIGRVAPVDRRGPAREARRFRASCCCRSGVFCQVSQHRRPFIQRPRSTVALRHRHVPWAQQSVRSGR